MFVPPLCVQEMFVPRGTNKLFVPRGTNKSVTHKHTHRHTDIALYIYRLQIHFTWMKVIGFHCCTNENDYIYSLRYCNIDKIVNNTMNHLYKYAIQWTILEYYHPSVGLILCHWNNNWWSNTNLQMFFVQKKSEYTN